MNGAESSRHGTTFFSHCQAKRRSTQIIAQSRCRPAHCAAGSTMLVSVFYYLELRRSMRFLMKARVGLSFRISWILSSPKCMKPQLAAVSRRRPRSCVPPNSLPFSPLGTAAGRCGSDKTMTRAMSPVHGGLDQFDWPMQSRFGRLASPCSRPFLFDRDASETGRGQRRNSRRRSFTVECRLLGFHMQNRVSTFEAWWHVARRRIKSFRSLWPKS